MIVILDGDEAGSYLRYLARNPPTQESGQCLDLDPEGSDCLCTRDGLCPYLDVEGVTCPVKSDLVEMAANLRSGPVYETAAPEWVEPEPDDGALHTYTVPATRKPHPNAWSDEEEEVIRRARNAKEAVTLYYGAYPQSSRTYAATQSRWYKLRAAGELIAPTPTPDFVGDTAPVTQCDEAAIRRPRFKAGDRVRIKHALHRGQTGEIRRYFPATENYLVAIDGMPDMIVLTDAQMEAV